MRRLSRGLGGHALCHSPRRLCTSIKATLTLPKTEFPLHAKPAAIEPQLAPRLAHEHYAVQESTRREAAPFVLHDGPPYANGELHLGHFLNKSLKDMINRWMILRGRRVKYTPGWDCHGLPIELRAMQLAGSDASDIQSLTPLQIRARAAACAREVVDAQRASFVRWGVMGDWDKPYTTMQPGYEAAQLGVLLDMVSNGLIFRGVRPVHWSPASRTALAEAELEYADEHISPATHVAFRLLPTEDAAGVAPRADAAASPDELEGASLVIWTTTPWTLPANQAICANPDLDYCLVEVGEHSAEGSAGSGTITDAKTGTTPASSSSSLGSKGPARFPLTHSVSSEGTPLHERLVVAEARVDALSAALGRPLTVISTVSGAALAGLSAAHPLSGRAVPLLFGSHVTDEAGTGLVHTAPGHGPDDFAVGQAHGLPAACPVDEQGRFTNDTDEASPFVGLDVLGGGNDAVIEALAANGALLAIVSYKHRYPYDWRSKTPVIFRTTPQWFCALDRLREPALAALDAVRMLPTEGRTRLESFVKGRTEWCLSRQRSWGVPIPAFYHVESGDALLTEETVAHVKSLVAEHGTNCWWEMTEAELLPPRLQAEAAMWRKGADTLDVWFDSGVSWSAVLDERSDESTSAAVQPRADLYLEGSDQHRGWFQSSLLTHVGASGTSSAPYAAIVTHGFVVDERGTKMSKSLGNVILPGDLIEPSAAAAVDAVAVPAPAPVPEAGAEAPRKGKGKDKKKRKEERDTRAKKGPIGVDVLRLWVATSDWTSDVAVGDIILQKNRESYRRLRNSCRFMLGNLHDFDNTRDAVPLEAMRMGDRYMLHQLHEFAVDVARAHDAHAIHRVVSSAITLASEALSADYFDATKDRLYCGQADGPDRRAVQTVLYVTLDTLLLALGPIVPFLTEEVHGYRKEPRPSAPIERLWCDPPPEWSQPEIARSWELCKGVRTEVQRLVHTAQQSKQIRGASEAMVHVHVESDSQLHTALEHLGGELNDLLGVSASRVHLRPPSVTDGGMSNDNAVLQGAGAEGALGAFDGFVSPPGARSHELELGSSVRLELVATENAKCERCWRYVPAPEVAHIVSEVHEGWVYRGCACYK